MSSWRETESTTKPGRREITTGPGAEVVMPLVFILGLVIALGPAIGMLFMLIGFALFLAAKLSVISQGVYVSWGSGRMSARFRKCYRVGYALMFLGAVAWVFRIT